MLYALFLTGLLLWHKWWVPLVSTLIACAVYGHLRFRAKVESAGAKAIGVWVALQFIGIAILWAVYRDQMRM